MKEETVITFSKFVGQVMRTSAQLEDDSMDDVTRNDLQAVIGHDAMEIVDDLYALAYLWDDVQESVSSNDASKALIYDLGLRQGIRTIISEWDFRVGSPLSVKARDRVFYVSVPMIGMDAETANKFHALMEAHEDERQALEAVFNEWSSMKDAQSDLQLAKDEGLS